MKEYLPIEEELPDHRQCSNGGTIFIIRDDTSQVVRRLCKMLNPDGTCKKNEPYYNPEKHNGCEKLPCIEFHLGDMTT